MFKQQHIQRETILNGMFFLALLLFVVPAVAVDIKVSVDRNPVMKNESFQLLFSATETPDGDPDFSPLNATLEVLNQQKNSQSSWVNGQSMKRIIWALNVIPKITGRITIPAISFGNDVTSSLTINVRDSSPISSTSNKGVLFLEVEVTPSEVYVQSQILYTMRLYHRVQITQASLPMPTLGNAIMEELDSDKQFNTRIRGVNYSVFERKYAIFPQQSGMLTIPPIKLTAQIVTATPRSRSSSVFNTQQSQTKRVSSNSVSINVLPIPSTFSASHWLAAENIHLQQTWSNDDLIVLVGEPLTRTLTLRGQGVISSQLPDLVTEHTSPNIKIYPDQPMLRDQKKSGSITAIREQKIAIIPSKVGRYEMPAINIAWFSTKTHQMKTATIPATTIIAIAPQVANIVIAEDGDSLPIKHTQYWMWIAILLAIAWVVTLIWITVRNNKKQPKEVNATPTSQKVTLKNIRKACLENNPQQAMQALLIWTEHQCGINQINKLNEYINDELQTEIKHLNEALYANKKQTWDGSQLIKLVEENTKSKIVKAKSTDSLQVLHKI